MTKKSKRRQYCDICNYLTECERLDLKGQNDTHFKGYLCKVCKSNYQLETTFTYPSQHLEDGDILKLIAWGINYLKEEFSKGGEPR